MAISGGGELRGSGGGDSVCTDNVGSGGESVGGT